MKKHILGKIIIAYIILLCFPFESGYSQKAGYSRKFTKEDFEWIKQNVRKPVKSRRQARSVNTHLGTYNDPYVIENISKDSPGRFHLEWDKSIHFPKEWDGELDVANIPGMWIYVNVDEPAPFELNITTNFSGSDTVFAPFLIMEVNQTELSHTFSGTVENPQSNSYNILICPIDKKYEGMYFSDPLEYLFFLFTYAARDYSPRPDDHILVEIKEARPAPSQPPAPSEPSLSSDRNYIHTRTYTSADGSRYLDQIQYFDGLGRPVQTVQKGITPTNKDLVTLQEYDAFGRESNSWLPAVISGNNGAFVNPETVKTSAISSNGNDQNPYSMPVYEASPLNRILKQFGPGQDWHNDGNENGRSVKTFYLTNRSGASHAMSEIKLQDDKTLGGIYTACNSISLLPGFHFQAASDKSLHLYVDPALCQQPSTKTTAMETSQTALRDEFLQCKKYQVINNSLKEEAHYDTGQLYVTLTMDEDDNQSLEFKDKLGQVVLTRQINNGQNYDTYYVYNDFGLQCFVLPPKIQDEGISQAKLDELAYRYQYDHRNRCIAKKIPGAEWNYYIYDKADRLILSQDGEQRAKGEWAFSIPDVFGRVVLTGTYTNSFDYLANPLGTVVVKAEYPQSGSGTHAGYNLSGIALATGYKILSANYYDNYKYFALAGFSTVDSYGLSGNSYEDEVDVYKHKGLLTGTMTAQMNPDGSVGSSNLYACLYYDDKKRLIQSFSTNHLGGIDEEYIVYNFTGQPVKKRHIHTKDTQRDGKQIETYAYTYDHAGRLLKTTHQLNNGAVVTLAENTYDELGRLKTNKKGGQDNLNTTYNYNVRSWTSDISSYHFNERLAYTYNGNISRMQWQQVGKWRTYDFAYDNLSRLKTAAYTGDGNFSTAYSYDKHGNMMTLQRYGLTAASSYGIIDSLTMTYNGNQMKTVSDAAADIALNTSMDFKEYTKGTGVEYFYNRNGAMYKDLNKGISQIAYNSLNLPRMVDIKNKITEGRNEYTYSASGQKLRAVQRWNPNYSTAPVIGSDVNVSALTNSSTTDYVGNIIYENNTLKRILVDGGYIEGDNYYFYINDHLGNNRVVANAAASVVQSTQYYPFGSSFADATGGSVQPYKYNGKELDARNGLNLYDSSARLYDPGVPLTLTPDPLAEKYYSLSPYSWVANNPMKFVDPDGRDYTVYFERDKDGNLTGLRIQAKVYITGVNASAERAGDLNKLAKNIFKSQEVDGVTVSFDVNYEYRENISSDDLAVGENILDFNNKVSTSDDRSHINGKIIGDIHVVGNTGEIYSGDNNNVVMHETGHLIGLADRYEDLDGGNLGSGGSFVHPGYEKDLMSKGYVNTKLDKSHYKHYVNMYGAASQNINTANGKIQVGWRKNRYEKMNLMTPYEKGGFHKAHPFKKR